MEKIETEQQYKAANLKKTDNIKNFTEPISAN